MENLYSGMIGILAILIGIMARWISSINAQLIALRIEHLELKKEVEKNSALCKLYRKDKWC